MTVIDLHKPLMAELRDALSCLDGDGFSDMLLSKVVCALLSSSRLSLIKRCAAFSATLQKAGVDPINAFFIAPPSGASVLAQLRSAGQLVCIENNMLALEMDDGSKFRTSLGGTRKLICTVRAIAELLGFDAVDQLVTDTRDASGQKDLEETALELSQRFEQYRLVRVGSMHQHRKFRAIRSFLKGRHPGENYSEHDISSEDVLEFWLQYAEFSHLSVRKYSSAHTAFCAYIQALAEALSTLTHTHPETESQTAYGNSAFEDWTALLEETADVELLKSAQYQRLSVLTNSNPAYTRMFASAFRVTRFNSTENKLSDKLSAADFNEVVSDLPTVAAVTETLEKDLEKFSTSAWAVLHVLIQNRCENAVFLAQGLSNGSIFHEGTPGLMSTELDCSHEQILKRSMELLCASEESQFISIRKQAVRAWRATERKGLRKDQLHDPDIVKSLEMLSMWLVGANAHIVAVRKRLNAHLSTESEDNAIFERKWRDLYLAQSCKGNENVTYIQ